MYFTTSNKEIKVKVNQFINASLLIKNICFMIKTYLN